MEQTDPPAKVASNAELGVVAGARCMCKDRELSACPGEWEPGCDLGNNPAHVRRWSKNEAGAIEANRLHKGGIDGA